MQYIIIELIIVANFIIIKTYFYEDLPKILYKNFQVMLIDNEINNLVFSSI